MKTSTQLLFLLLPIIFFGQNKKLEVKINRITTEEINSESRKYLIDYQIENRTSSAVSFFLIPNALIANTASSMTLFPVYKIYQNGVFEDMDGPFFEFETEEELQYAAFIDKNSEEAITLAKTIQTNRSIVATTAYNKYKENGGKSTDFQWVYYNQKILNNIVVLEPNKSKSFTIKTLWNKNRYIKNDHLEYFLNDTNKIEIELTLDLKTNLFKGTLSDEDLMKINADTTFIKGIFVSNKMELKFND
jgi:hypothetical protein